MLRKISTFTPLLLLLFAGYALAFGYNYISADQFKGDIEKGKSFIVVDIQVADEFARHHFKNSIETNAYPVKTEEEKQRIDPAVQRHQKTGHTVVVVCPRGGGGAKRCYDYMKSQGVSEEDLVILKGGVEKWPYREMLAGK